MKNQELRERVLAYNREVAKAREVAEIVDAVGLTIDARPQSPPSRPGHAWQPYLSTTSKLISWVESDYDATLAGTAENPIPYAEGLSPLPNYYYTCDGVRKVWTGEAGQNPAWDDDNFVEF